MPDQNSTFSDAEVGGAVQSCPASKPSHWIEIEMVGEDDSPVPLLQYEVRLPDGQLVQGYLDDQGLARIEGITTAGMCEVNFPEFDHEVWQVLTAAAGKPHSGSDR